MAAKNQDFEMYQGDTQEVNITIKGPTGAVLDVSGATFKWAMKQTVYSTPIVTKDTAAGITIIEALAGRIMIKLAPSDTQVVKADKYYHECEMTDKFGNVSTIFVGTLTLLASGV